MSRARALPLDDEEERALDAVLERIYHEVHFDFRGYARSSLKRCVARALGSLGLSTTSELLARIGADPAVVPEVLRHLTVQTSELFRDPGYYRCLRESVAPHLATYPSLRVWVAGCGAGEEAYSIAILLHEVGLLERALVYATDIDAESLRSAEAGVFPARRLAGFSASYFAAGGTASLSDYYTAAYARASFRPFLRERILFSDHSLATDAPFAEVQLVSCRNVLIYFGRELQERAIGLFRESLCRRGFLGIGAAETLSFSGHASAFEELSLEQRVYRMR